MAPKQPTRPAQPAGAAVETKSPTRPPEPSPAPVKREAQPAKPVSVHIHNSAVLELPSQPAGSNANPDRKPARQIEPNMRAMIDAAVKAGNITKCPPRTFAFDAAEPGQSWRKTGARKSGSKPRKGLLTSDRKPIEEDGE